MKACPKCNSSLKKIMYAEVRYDFEITRKNNFVMGEMIGAIYDRNPIVKCTQCEWKISFSEAPLIEDK